jgi:diguanylate cyclase (GGDEF)-like protein/putative nucleotidyltransferase with HDIG domain
LPQSRQPASASDSLALAARVLVLASEPGEDALARALGAEAATLLRLPAAAITALPAVVASGPGHAVVRDAAAVAELLAGAGPAPAALVVRIPPTEPGATARALVAGGPEADVADPATLELALAFAGAAAAAFAHQATGLEHRHQAEQNAALARAAKALNESSLDLSTLLARICEEAAGLIGAESAVVYRVTAEHELTVESAHALPPEHLGMTLAAGAGLAGKVLEADRPMMTEDYGAVGRPPAGSPWAGVEASVAVPVHWGGQLRGVLSVAYWHPVRLTRRHMDALEAFAELAAVAFQNASAHATLARAARTDPLTGCLNHAALHEGLARELERAERGQCATLSLILLDLDRFKAVNDEHGHLVGDEVLRRVGHALRTTTRPYDLAARYGGDEFALIAVEADEVQAIEIAARAIERISLALGDLAEAGGARATAGVAEWSPGLTAGDLIARADRALLYGKRADRRGEVLCSSDLPSTFLPSRADRRDRRLPLQQPAMIAQWNPRTDDDAAERLRKRTRQLAIANQLGARLAAMTDVREIHGAVVEELHEAFDFFLCAVIRIREDGDVESAAGRGEAFIRLGDASWRQPFGYGLIGRCLRTRRPVCIGDVYAQPEYHPTPETESVRSELCVPLFVDGALYGAINVESVEPDAFDEDDVRLLQTVADQVGAAMRSAVLYERLERAYLGTAEALAAALEAKDEYTADHARIIAEQAEAVGRRLGMDEAELRDLRLGAVFHDIGKIAVPEAILNKPGPLTPAERDVMQRHTVVGEQILAPVEFLAGVCRLVRHEHERWDGGGYPDGLGGEQIPLGSRIILACDAFHAMTSDRPYRRALPEGVAQAELRRNAGTQFDPAVVDALLAEIGAAQREPVTEE